MSIISNSVAIIALWGSGLCFLNALTVWWLRDRPRLYAALLSALFLCLGVFLLRNARFEWVAYSNASAEVPAAFWTLRFAWIYWIGPLSWFWLRSTIVSGYRPGLRAVLILLLPGLGLLLLDLHILLNAEHHAVYFNTCLGSRLSTLSPTAGFAGSPDLRWILGMAGLAGVFVYLSCMTYFAFSLRTLLRLWSFNEMPGRVRLLAAYLSGGLVAQVLLLVGDLFLMDLPRYLALVWIVLMLAAQHLACMRDPGLLDGLRREGRRKSYERSAIAQLDTSAALARLDELMRTEHVYLDEDLSLDGLAAELKLSRHQLSGLLNECLQKNFHSYVNEFRINAARRMLIEEPRRSVLSVAGAVGFNSRSSFHTAFQKYSGCTPQQFRSQTVA